MLLVAFLCWLTFTLILSAVAPADISFGYQFLGAAAFTIAVSSFGMYVFKTKIS